MAERSNRARNRSGMSGDVDAFDRQLQQRRWRILRTALPRGHEVGNLPLWITEPEQFLGWIAPRLSPMAGAVYFADLERIARQTSDLELFRLARRFRGAPARPQ